MIYYKNCSCINWLHLYCTCFGMCWIKCCAHALSICIRNHVSLSVAFHKPNHCHSLAYFIPVILIFVRLWYRLHFNFDLWIYVHIYTYVYVIVVCGALVSKHPCIHIIPRMNVSFCVYVYLWGCMWRRQCVIWWHVYVWQWCLCIFLLWCLCIVLLWSDTYIHVLYVTQDYAHTPNYRHSLSVLHTLILIFVICGTDTNDPYSGGGTWPCVTYYLHKKIRNHVSHTYTDASLRLKMTC